MDAIITAGGSPQPNEPLYPFTQGGYKAMLEIAGKPMIRWVMDAIAASPYIDRLLVVGLPSAADLPCSKPVVLLENQGDMTNNIRYAATEIMAHNPQAEHCILFASDTPTITTEMVDWMAQIILASDAEVIYPAIARSVMETRFPNSKRSYTLFKDTEYCGADIIGLRPQVANSNNPLWEKLTAARKSTLRQAALLGYDTLFLLMLRRLSIAEAEVMISRRLNVRGRVLICPYAEMGMDVDKPHQLEIVRADLAARAEGRV